MKEETLKVNDGRSVFLASWEPAGRQRGVVGLVHGLGEHSGLLATVAEYLSGKGYLALAPDLPGHGRNPGKRGSASYAQVEELVDALAAELRRRAGAGSPVFLYGNSMGASCILHWQVAHPGERVAGIVASAPSIGAPEPKPSAGKKVLGRVMAKIWPSFSMENGLDLSNLSRDQVRAEAIRRDPLFFTTISASLGVGFLDSWGWFARWPGGSLASPVLFLQGTGDRIVDPRATIALAGKLTGDVTLKTWDGFYHVLHEEPERAEVLAYLAAWMDQHAA